MFCKRFWFVPTVLAVSLSVASVCCLSVTYVLWLNGAF